MDTITETVTDTEPQSDLLSEILNATGITDTEMDVSCAENDQLLDEVAKYCDECLREGTFLHQKQQFMLKKIQEIHSSKHPVFSLASIPPVGYQGKADPEASINLSCSEEIITDMLQPGKKPPDSGDKHGENFPGWVHTLDMMSRKTSFIELLDLCTDLVLMLPDLCTKDFHPL